MKVIFTRCRIRQRSRAGQNFHGRPLGSAFAAGPARGHVAIFRLPRGWTCATGGCNSSRRGTASIRSRSCQRRNWLAAARHAAIPVGNRAARRLERDAVPARIRFAGWDSRRMPVAPDRGATGGMDANGYNGTLDSNILRALPGDPVTPPVVATPQNTPDTRRRLFELGTLAEHQFTSLPVPGPVGIDYATKNRVLSKILQNTTTRSNVFLVWIQIDFFQAKDVNPPNGVVRIGARLTFVAGPYRGFFVIDRSQAMSLMGQQFLPAVDPTTDKFVFSLNQSFNYQSLVLFRQRIQ